MCEDEVGCVSDNSGDDVRECRTRVKVTKVTKVTGRRIIHFLIRESEAFIIHVEEAGVVIQNGGLVLLWGMHHTVQTKVLQTYQRSSCCVPVCVETHLRCGPFHLLLSSDSFSPQDTQKTSLRNHIIT